MHGHAVPVGRQAATPRRRSRTPRRAGRRPRPARPSGPARVRRRAGVSAGRPGRGAAVGSRSASAGGGEPVRLDAVGGELGGRALEPWPASSAVVATSSVPEPIELDRPAGSRRPRARRTPGYRSRERRPSARSTGEPWPFQVRRQHAGRGLRRRPAPRRPRVDDAHRAPGLGQLERHRTADDPGADDDDVWLRAAARTHFISG